MCLQCVGDLDVPVRPLVIGTCLCGMINLQVPSYAVIVIFSVIILVTVT